MNTFSRLLLVVLLGSLIAITGAAATLKTGDRHFMELAATGSFIPFTGWRLHNRRNGGQR